MDSKRLYIGDNFDELPDFISIWILSYDPFGQNRMIYSIKNVVTEDTSLMYNDGVMKLFLYTDGEKGGSKELRDLLRFFNNTCDSNAVDDDLRKLLSLVNKIKQSKEVGEQFMRFENDWDIERRLLREEIREEIRKETQKEAQEAGRIEGRIEGIIKSYRKFNATNEQIISTLIEDCNLSEAEARKKLTNN